MMLFGGIHTIQTHLPSCAKSLAKDPRIQDLCKRHGNGITLEDNIQWHRQHALSRFILSGVEVDLYVWKWEVLPQE